MQEHSLLGRHRCGYCSYSSDRKYHVFQHERIHTGERPFECPVCGQCFTVRCNLNTHLLVHSGEKPHECLDCGERFSQAGSLMRHRTTMHFVCGKSALLTCPQCGKGFRRRRNLEKHTLTHTGGPGRPTASSHPVPEEVTAARPSPEARQLEALPPLPSVQDALLDGRM
ncbi:zinc finger protein 711-like [Amblyomma americanum]